MLPEPIGPLKSMVRKEISADVRRSLSVGGQARGAFAYWVTRLISRNLADER